MSPYIAPTSTESFMLIDSALLGKAEQEPEGVVFVLSVVLQRCVWCEGMHFGIPPGRATSTGLYLTNGYLV